MGIVFLGTVPFLQRAVFLDEHLLLQLAESALKNGWWAHQDVSTIFFGTRLQNLASHTHPPVVEYCLALLLKLFGGYHNSAFRLIFSVFPLSAALAFYELARRFTQGPVLVTALFASSPAFFVMSPTLMADIPALSFLLIGFALYFRGKLWTTSLFFALAMGTTYPMVIPFCSLLLWIVLRRLPARELAVLSVAPVPLALWLLITAIRFRQIPMLDTARYMLSHGSAGHNSLALMSFLGGTAVFPWLFVFMMPIEKKKLVVMTGLSVLVVTACSALQSWPATSYWLAYLVMASSGMALLFRFASAIVERHRRESGVLLFTIWVVATLLFFMVVAEIIAVRYLLLIMPPLYLVCFRDFRPNIGIAVLVATLTLSVTLAIADYRLAGSYRDWVDQTVPALQKAGFKVWSGAESGLRFYLQGRGIETLGNDDLRPVAADLIVRQDLFSYGLSTILEPELVAVHSDDLEQWFPIRTLSKSAHAGFHDSHMGLLPYVFSRVPLDRISIVEVSPFVISLPQVVPPDFSSVPVWSPDGVVLKQVDREMVFHPRIASDSLAQYEQEGSSGHSNREEYDSPD